MFGTLHYIMRLRVINHLKFDSEYNKENGEIVFTKTLYKHNTVDGSPVVGSKLLNIDLKITDRETKELPLGVFSERIGIDISKWGAVCDEITHEDSLRAVNLFYRKACNA